MNKKNKALLSKVLCVGVLSLGVISTANAALVSTLGGLAVYDTDRDISWLSDANAGAGSSFDNGSNTTDGRMTWDNANAWAASLNVGGVTGWRLPTAFNTDGTGPCIGFNCTGSEMGHLFHVEGITAAAPGVFSNVQPNVYWSGTEFSPNPSFAWGFSFGGGFQDAGGKGNDLFAWAVHSGDVGASAVSEPGTIVLMGLGLVGLLGLGRRQRRR